MSYSEARERYSYPAAHLRVTDENLIVGNLDQTDLQFIRPLLADAANDPYIFNSTVELDQYHSELLNSDSVNDVILGLASVCYWGNYLVRGHENHNFSVTRLSWFFSGNARATRCLATLGHQYAFDRVSSAKVLINHGEYGKALSQIADLPFFSRSFASKVLAFMAPSMIGVYDSHIATQLHDLEMAPTGPMNPAAENTFDLSCQQWQSKADELNNAGKTWTDWDGSQHNFRAVDVERAEFAISTNM